MNALPPDDVSRDPAVAAALRARRAREQGYRARALKLFPWICGRCAREFDHRNVHELSVHHRDHDHDNNPPDGSNWELLCLYCHDEEHRRQFAAGGRGAEPGSSPATQRPFADLGALLAKKDS